MTAPIGQRLRCAFFGHTWRRVIGPREGYYLRCRRCWVTDEVDSPQVSEASAGGSWHHGLHHQA